MRALVIPLLLLTLCGCVSAEAKRQATINEACWNRFAVLIDAGQTTREQEQAFIRDEAKNATAMRKALGVAEVK
jgi:hypothetical protein